MKLNHRTDTHNAAAASPLLTPFQNLKRTYVDHMKTSRPSKRASKGNAIQMPVGKRPSSSLKALVDADRPAVKVPCRMTEHGQHDKEAHKHGQHCECKREGY